LNAGLAAWAALPLLVIEAYRANRRPLQRASDASMPVPVGAYSGSPDSSRVVGKSF